MEADIYPASAPERAIEIEGALGDGSHFHLTFGYYAHAAGPESVVGPDGWQDRLVRVALPARPGSDAAPIGLFLEPHDLVLSKCVAGRDRDWEFARDALRAGIVGLPELLRRTRELPVDERAQAHIEAMLRRPV